MSHGTLFILLFLTIAAGVAVLLVVRIFRRALVQRLRAWSIVAIGVAALAVWAGASYPIFLLTFGTAWGVAHLQPTPTGVFPEGWTIYAFLLAYLALGAILFFLVGRLPRRSIPT
jgi:hypothetical protein